MYRDAFGESLQVIYPGFAYLTGPTPPPGSKKRLPVSLCAAGAVQTVQFRGADTPLFPTDKATTTRISGIMSNLERYKLGNLFTVEGTVRRRRLIHVFDIALRSDCAGNGRSDWDRKMYASRRRATGRAGRSWQPSRKHSQ